MNKQTKHRSGFTLIELLLVVSIILILTSLLVPRLRALSKERNLREAARVTGSIFTQASQRAIADGVAGVLLEYNPNFADATGFSNAVTNMSLLRAVPPFSGDQSPIAGVGAYQRGTFGTPTTTIPTPPPIVNTVEIPYPIEQEDLQIVKSGDSISFGQSSSEYSIVSVVPQPTTSPTVLELLLDVGYLPDPNGFLPNAVANPGVAYTIHRLPRELRSSEVELPRNVIVDTRFSGFNMLDTSGLVTSVFEPNPTATVTVGGSPEVVDFTTSDIGILFNARGELDRMVRLASDSAGNTHLLQSRAVDNLRLFISEIITDVDNDDPDDNPLNSDTNLWVAVNRSAGTANVGYNVNANAGTTLNNLSEAYESERDDFNALISESRDFSAAQTASQ